MSVALPCPKCNGAVVQGHHVDRDSCGSTPYPVVRMNPTGKESLNDILNNVVAAIQQPPTAPAAPSPLDAVIAKIEAAKAAKEKP